MPCRAVEAAAEGTTDIVGLAFWWSNCLQLRWMLWAMSHGGGSENDGPGSGVDEFDWVLQVPIMAHAVAALYPREELPGTYHISCTGKEASEYLKMCIRVWVSAYVWKDFKSLC